MSTKKYKVNLSEEEKLHLQAVLRKGKSAARKRACIQVAAFILSN